MFISNYGRRAEGNVIKKGFDIDLEDSGTGALQRHVYLHGFTAF